MSRKEHWEKTYTGKPADKLGWHTPHLTTSFEWIEGLGLDPDAPIIDVGGGVCTLADDLLAAGHRDITVLDLSGQALELAKKRLGDAAKQVAWIEGDITTVKLPINYYALWHDRAVFHFLTESEAQQQYAQNLRHALRTGGYALIATFAPEAPPTCSGLPVQRYDPERLHAVLGAEFSLIRHHKEMHVTPGGVNQMYQYCLFRR